MQSVVDSLTSKAQAARMAAREMARLPTAVKNESLRNIAESLHSRRAEILEANAADCEESRRQGLSEAVLDRLRLNEERLASIADDVRRIIELPDPVGEVLEERTLPNGLEVRRRRVPLGVIGAIYESRPNITIDISSLCFKAGNAVVLRGGKEAFHSNAALAGIVRDAIEKAGGPKEAVQFVESTDRQLVGEMLKMTEYIDLMIPRGGAELVRRVAEDAAMPAVTGGIGVCHVYVDSEADVDMAVEVSHNAKVQRPTVCNALDTLLVHSAVSPKFLPKIGRRWTDSGVEMRCDRRSRSLLEPLNGLQVKKASESDWGREHLALVASVRVVDSLDDAMKHIETYGSGHSEAIVTEDSAAAERFLDEVDASVVLVNASTRFNDGGQLGLGAEVAISTNKLHARGPMGLRELTSYKWTVVGEGQIRS